MKYANLIFSILLFAFSFTDCCLDTAEKIHTLLETQSIHHEKHEGRDLSHSMDCHCSNICAHIVSIGVPSIEVIRSLTFTNISFLDPEDSLYTEYLESIFHPPIS